MKFGLNLYSIRNLIQTETDFLETAKKLKEMGYDYLQFSGAPFDPQVIKRVSMQTGMPICLTHVPLDRILNDTKALMNDHEIFGCINIGLGSLPQQTVFNEQEFKQRVKELNDVAKLMQDNGFKFFYHHHHFEFFKHGDVTAFDYMIENAPYVNFTADTYWLQYGGVEIVPTLEKLNGRIGCVHLKDYKIKPKDDGGSEPAFAPVGDGVINFKRVIEKMKTLGVEYYLVEQDNAADMPNTLEQVEKSIKYLKRNFN